MHGVREAISLQGGRPRRGLIGGSRAAASGRRWLVVAALTGMVAAASVAPVGAAPPAKDVPEITVLSNRADLISGGDALVEVAIPDGVDASTVVVELNGQDITEQFSIRPNGRYQGLVTGLRLGENTLTAMTSRKIGATLTITNHPKQGPVIDRLNRRHPFICSTEEAGLGPATDEDCSAPTRYDFFYRSTVTDDMEAYDPESPPPSPLIAMTTTDQGKTVPFIVRRERGVVGRGIYDIAVLFDPEKDAAWSPWNPGSAWNGKLQYHERGGCPYKRHVQGVPDEIVKNGSRGSQGGVAGRFLPGIHVGSWSSNGLFLSRGYAVATSSHNQCTPTTHSVEGVIMTKEHFIESYGVPRFTSAEGCSGGSGQVHNVVNGYPGVFDGVLTWCSVPDGPTVIAHTFYSCSLLAHYLANDGPPLWLDPQDRMAVYGNSQDCELIGGTAVGDRMETYVADPRDCAPGPPEWAYDRETNPTGVRCAHQDLMPGLFGTRPKESWGQVEQQIGRGFTNRFFDNVGVQYGFVPLLMGQITPEQFVDLNEKVGGVDLDGLFVDERTRADIGGLRNLYRSELMNDASHMDEVPIVDVTWIVQEAHPAFYREQLRARMIAANGHADNQIRWTDMGAPYVREEAWLALDRWLTAIESDTSDDPIEVKVVRNKPADIRDTCWLATGPESCEGSQELGSSDPVRQAGGPLAGDVFKCRLKPIDWSEYGSVQFSDEQKRRLEATFPEGVCDWSKPGVEQQPMDGTWRTYMDTVGGRPLGPEPQSAPIKGRAGRTGAPRSSSSRSSDVVAAGTATVGPLPATGGAAVLPAMMLLLAAGVTYRQRGKPSRRPHAHERLQS